MHARFFATLSRRTLAGLCLGVLLTLQVPVARADDATTATVQTHIRAAEIALQQHEYREATVAYLQAAALSGEPATARRATRVAFTYGFNQEALEAAERWEELDPDSEEALLYVAQLQLRMGDLRKSQKSFRKLIRQSGSDGDERLLDLIPVLSREDAQDGHKIMRYLAKGFDESATANYAVGVMALQAGDDKAAAARATKAMELEKDWIKPKLLYARSLLLGGDSEAAIEYAARIVGDDPDPDPAARQELAILYMSADRDDDALSQVNQILLEQPSRHDALRLMAIINFRQENLDAARADFRDLLASGSYTMDALYYLARIADYRGETDRALALYMQVNKGPHAVVSQRRASGIIAHESSVERAVDHLQTFAEQYPHLAVDMTLAQAQLLASEEQLDEALEIYDRVLSYRPDDERVVLGRGEVMLRLGREDEAIEIYRQAVRRWPDSAQTLNALGYTLTNHGTNYKEAARLIEKALKLEPDNAAIIDSYGWVLYRQGEHEKALVELQRAWRSIKDVEVAAHIIEVLGKLERCDEAREMLEAAELHDSKHPLLPRARELSQSCGQ
ncbi:MAG: tetratricopeptide repeat protein [Woeseia sp.]|nr:tetratricopeptide repeat protein [Woeseia sp.]